MLLIGKELPIYLRSAHEVDTLHLTAYSLGTMLIA